MLLKIYCEICGEFIAQAEMDDLSLPLMGHMFLSTQPERKVPPPFNPDIDWIHMRCPYGPHRPFIHTNRLMTDRGFVPVKTKITVEEEGKSLVDEIFGFEPDKGIGCIAPGTEMDVPEKIVTIQTEGVMVGKQSLLICPHCSRTDFKSKAGYIAHVKACEKKNIKED